MRRVCLIGAAIAAGPLAIGVTVSPAAAPAVTKVTCKLALTTVPPAGESTVTPAAEKAAQYGTVSCGKVFGQGAQQDSYVLMTSGAIVGRYKQYFGTGTLKGAFKLLPDPEAAPPPSSTGFSTQTYKGTYSLVSGTGTWQKTKGTANVKCVTTDGVHFGCTEKLKLTQV